MNWLETLAIESNLNKRSWRRRRRFIRWQASTQDSDDRIIRDNLSRTVGSYHSRYKVIDYRYAEIGMNEKKKKNWRKKN